MKINKELYKIGEFWSGLVKFVFSRTFFKTVPLASLHLIWNLLLPQCLLKILEEKCSLSRSNTHRTCRNTAELFYYQILLNLKSPSQDLQNSLQGFGISGRSHLGIAPAYIVVLNMLNINSRASIYSTVCCGTLFSRQPNRHSYRIVATPAHKEMKELSVHMHQYILKIN